ncbi:MAG: hypothetical protein HY800_06610 [Ignavibacteriales bacterium]|nr:hypothetical protein [Ignavibacteriales bacterium]
MKIVGQILSVLGTGLLLWGIYQYFTNQPTQIKEPKDIAQGIEAITDMYNNVLEKPQKQAQAKDIGVVGGIMLIVSVVLILIGKRDTHTSSVPSNVIPRKLYCNKCGRLPKPRG